MRSNSHLRHADYRAAYWLLGECCELGRLPEDWSGRLFQRLESLIGISLGLFIEGTIAMAYGQGRGPYPLDHVLVHGAGEQDVLGIIRKYWENNAVEADPAMAAWRKVRSRIATRARQHLVPNRVWRRSVITNEYFRAFGFEEMILSRCPSTNKRWLLLNFWRNSGNRPFNNREHGMVHLISTELHRLLAQGRIAAFCNDTAVLTPRLRQVLGLLCQGLSEKQTANRLGISPHTVHNQIQQLHRVLGVSTRGELIATALRYHFSEVCSPHRP